jgi:hypothetical protein
VQDQKKHTTVGGVSRSGGLLGHAGSLLGRHGWGEKGCFDCVCYLERGWKEYKQEDLEDFEEEK